jgi:hypothetical protein
MWAVAANGSARAAGQFTITPGSFATVPSTLQAGAHPDLETTFSIDSEPSGEPIGGNTRNLELQLPAGLVGAANATPTCTMQQVYNGYFPEKACPPATVVGEADLKLFYLGTSFTLHSLVYNIEPYRNEPAAFGLFAIYPVRLDTKVRTGGDYGITVYAQNLTEGASIIGSDITFWGVPAEHNGGGGKKIALLTNPSACGGAEQFSSIKFNIWQEPGFQTGANYAIGQATGCDQLALTPAVAFRPETGSAGLPNGFDFDLSVPQNEDPTGLATPNVKDVNVALPKGVTLSPGSAEGLIGCPDSAVGIGSESKPSCPDSSRIGSVEIATPLLDEPLKGSMYLGTQLSNDPRSGQMVRLFLVAEGSGVTIKLPGSVVVDPETGQLTASFKNNPQLPFSDLSVDFTGGPRAPLTTPAACGTYTTQAEVTSYAGGPPVKSASAFVIDENCDGGSRFTPSLEAGTTNPVGGKSSSFVLTVKREDGQQNLAAIGVTLPQGLLAKLAGVPVCGDAEAASGSCAEASKIGSATVAAGDGSAPLWVPQPGKAPTGVYLAGPHKGAPYSIVTKVPAQAGPFDLGTVVVRSALQVDPTTTQVSAVSDPLPQIVSGVPVSYRTVNLNIDRSQFMVNPTSCEPTQVTSSLRSAGGATASPSDRFQVADCGALAFGPKLALQMKGALKRTGHPALTATLTQPAGENANIAATTVTLPKSFFIDQGHVDNPCTRVQFNANACPPKSVLGTAVAYTPLLDKPLEGPVYFRSNGGERQLPDLVADLNGQIHVTLVGFIDSKKVGKETSLVRTRFASVPDAPVSKFVLKLKGGKRGLIQNSADLCRVRPKAEVRMAGQNGKTHDFKQPISVRCGKKSKHKKAQKNHHK